MQLEISLSKIAQNYQRILKLISPNVICAPMLKYNAYGLGAAEIIRILFGQGCRSFFVANVDEACMLYETLSAEISSPIDSNSVMTQLFEQKGSDDSIKNHNIVYQIKLYVSHGINTLEGAEACLHYGFVPILNTFDQIEIWCQALAKYGIIREGGLHFDTGLNRLGFMHSESVSLINKLISGQYPELNITLIMSHLACADIPGNSYNEFQLLRFKQLLVQYMNTASEGSIIYEGRPGSIPLISLANSSAILLGQDYHFDVVRPGMALYGEGKLDISELKKVFSLKLRVVQRRNVDEEGYCGYYCRAKISPGQKLLTIEYGYADGLPSGLANSYGVLVPIPDYIRSNIHFLANNMLSGGCNKEYEHDSDVIAALERYKKAGYYWLPFVGRISMDLAVVDASELPDYIFERLEWVELLNEVQGIDDMVSAFRGNPYDVLTKLNRSRHGMRYVA